MTHKLFYQVIALLVVRAGYNWN